MPKAVLIWKYAGSSKPVSLAPSRDAERLAICFSNSEIHMLDKNGKLSWKTDSKSSSITNASDIAHASQQNMTLVGTQDKKYKVTIKAKVKEEVKNKQTKLK